MEKRALVCGAGGFIGGHLVNWLKKEGYYVIGVDIKRHEYQQTSADKFIVGDLRDPNFTEEVIDQGEEELRFKTTKSFDDDVTIRIPDISKAMDELGFKPTAKVEESVRRCLNHYKSLQE